MELILERVLERGWAVRGALGTTYGARYMCAEYRRAIIEMYRAGDAHKGSKSSPGLMHGIVLLVSHTVRVRVTG